MKKIMTVLLCASFPLMALTGCESMSTADQRIGTAALGGAIGGGWSR